MSTTFQSIVPADSPALPMDSYLNLASSGMLGEGPQNSATATGLLTGGVMPSPLTDKSVDLSFPARLNAASPTTPSNPNLLQQATNGTLAFTPNPLSVARTGVAADGSIYYVPPGIAVVSEFSNLRASPAVSRPITDQTAIHYGHDDEKVYTYSGTDIRVMLEMANPVRGQTKRAKQLLELHTISVSIYRVKATVRACGYINPKGFARGTRTISGTMIMTPFTVDVLQRFLLNGVADNDVSEDSHYTKPDQLPPFHLTLLFADEFGNVSSRRLLGVDMSTDGTVYSQHDMFTEQTITYMAADFTPLQTNLPVRQAMPSAPATPMTVISGDSVKDIGQYGTLPAAPPYGDTVVDIGQFNDLPVPLPFAPVVNISDTEE